MSGEISSIIDNFGGGSLAGTSSIGNLQLSSGEADLVEIESNKMVRENSNMTLSPEKLFAAVQLFPSKGAGTSTATPPLEETKTI